jgi:TRAP-type C4-dicarboxylate transport system permease small subunit
MKFIIITNVVARYVFNYALSWAEEVSRYMMVWMIMLGAAMAVRLGAYFRMEMIGHSFGMGVRNILIWVTGGYAAIVGLLLLWEGITLLPFD